MPKPTKPTPTKPATPTTDPEKAPARRQRPSSTANGPKPPRSGSKAETLLKQLRKPRGATISALSRALAWQPHSVRAAITGLRKRGYGILREKTKTGETRYRQTDAG